MTNDDVVHFSDFLEKHKILPNDERIPLLKAAWNQALESMGERFDDIEGSDYGLTASLSAK